MLYPAQGSDAELLRFSWVIRITSPYLRERVIAVRVGILKSSPLKLMAQIQAAGLTGYSGMGLGSGVRISHLPLPVCLFPGMPTTYSSPTLECLTSISISPFLDLPDFCIG